MLDRNDYYNKYKKTAANSDDLLLQPLSLFPQDGILIGDFVAPTGEIAPALVPIDQTNGICFLSTPQNAKEINKVMQMMALRLVCSIPAGKCKFVLYDGIGVGVELILLSGLDTKIKGEEIITNPNVFKEKIRAINNEIPKIVQNVLGAKNAGKTIVEYNQMAGELAQPYTFIIISDFPQTLDKETIELLHLTIKNGRKAGVFVIMNLDTSIDVKNRYNDNPNDDFEPLRFFLDTMTIIYKNNNRYFIKSLLPDKSKINVPHSFSLQLDSTIPDNIDDVIDLINQRIADRLTAKLSISSIFTKDNLWKSSSLDGIDIPIGKSNDSAILYFNLGKKHHHCLIGGRSGSGKSVLLHNIICNGSWLYSPDELQFILLDFKDGVEFNAYRDFPNVKVLSVKSDTSFALNVFRFFDDEMRMRAELIKNLNVANFKELNLKSKNKLPRYVIIVDEFQKMFETNYKTRNELESEVENIVRQGRSYGINLVLCTQSLGDLNMKLAEFSLRIGLPFSSEKECRRICYNSTLPLSYETGQAIYCSNPDGKNSVPFRVAYIDRSDIIKFQNLIRKSNKKYLPFDRYLFDGDNHANFKDLVRAKNAGDKAIYIGCPMALKKEHAYYVFNRKQGSNMLIVGQDVYAATSIVYHTIKQLLLNVTRKDAIIICDKTSEDSSTFAKLSELSGKNDCNYFYLKSDTEITKWVKSISEKVRERNSGITENYGEIYLILFNSFNYLPARWRGELEPKESIFLSDILKDGPNYGIHLIVYSDTYKHYLSTFRQKYQFEWGIKAAVKGGESSEIFDNEERQVKSELESLFIKDSLRDEHADRIIVYKM